MSLSDFCSRLGLALWTQGALIIFVAVFVVLLARLFRPGHVRAHRLAASLPLHDAPAATPAHAAIKRSNHG